MKRSRIVKTSEFHLIDPDSRETRGELFVRHGTLYMSAVDGDGWRVAWMTVSNAGQINARFGAASGSYCEFGLTKSDVRFELGDCDGNTTWLSPRGVQTILSSDLRKERKAKEGEDGDPR